jgi:hypothetical protein
MNGEEDNYQFRVTGFSAHRMGNILAALSFCFLPVHTSVSCDESGGLFAASIGLFVITVALCFFTPRGSARRFSPALWAFVGMVSNSMVTH